MTERLNYRQQRMLTPETTRLLISDGFSPETWAQAGRELPDVDIGIIPGRFGGVMWNNGPEKLT